MNGRNVGMELKRNVSDFHPVGCQITDRQLTSLTNAETIRGVPQCEINWPFHFDF